jgi:hypothetical protein
MDLRLTLLWVVALIAMFAVGAPTALAGDDSDLAAPVADTTLTAPTTAVESTSLLAPAADADQSSQNSASSGASNGSSVSHGAGQTQSTGPDGSGQSQQLAQDANIDQAADSEANAQQHATNANVPANLYDSESGGDTSAEQHIEARSDASNQAEVGQNAQQDQSAEGGGGGGSGEVRENAEREQSGGGGSGGGGSAQVQQAEQNAEIDATAQAEATGEQQATGTSPQPADIDWSAILSQLSWAGGVEEIVAMAQNESLVIQAIWQVQHGCNKHCTKTRQSQSATQGASTTQDATAVADGGTGAANGDTPVETESSGGVSAPSSAEARYSSVTLQFIWQTQIGCFAFCFETSQSQAATQWAQTDQSASAVGGSSALAENLSETLQLVWQLQQGCEVECYGTSQVQVINQGSETTQPATPTANGVVLMPVLGQDGTVVIPRWLVSLAENLGVTTQTIYQLQEAVCAEYCEGDSQVQDAGQQAEVSQEAAARAGDPPLPVEEPLSEEPPAQQAPTTQPPAPATPAPGGGDNATGVCNSASATRQCEQTNVGRITQNATATGGGRASNTASQSQTNQLAGRDTTGSGAGGPAPGAAVVQADGDDS